MEREEESQQASQQSVLVSADTSRNDNLQKRSDRVLSSSNNNGITKDAIDLADRASRKISAYPHKLRTEPPLPHGFVEGALLGMATYLVLRPVRSVAAKYVGRNTGDDNTMKNIFNMIFTVGQVMAGAQVALYGAVYTGSNEWLSIVTDYASAPTPTSAAATTTTITMNNSSRDYINYHKSILADEICQDPVITKYYNWSSIPTRIQQQQQQQQQTYKIDEEETKNDTSNNNVVSIMEWVQDPEKVMTEQLLRAVKACRDRKKKKNEDDSRYSSPSTNNSKNAYFLEMKK